MNLLMSFKPSLFHDGNMVYICFIMYYGRGRASTVPVDRLRLFGAHTSHDDVTKWKHFPRYWPFVRGIHRSPVNTPHKGYWRGALIFSLICVWINGWVNNREVGDLRRYRAHCDVIVMWCGLVGMTKLIPAMTSVKTSTAYGPLPYSSTAKHHRTIVLPRGANDRCSCWEANRENWIFQPTLS